MTDQAPGSAPAETPPAGTSPAATPPLKVDIKQTLLIGFGFMSCMIAWTFYNFKVPIILNGITGTDAGTWTRVGILGTAPVMEIVGGALMTLDNIIAILLQPYFGQISDRLESRYGRRTPFVIIGIPAAVTCLFVLPFTTLLGPNLVTVAVAFIGVVVVFNLAMAFYRPPVMSLLPDKTPPQALSTANSFISLMGGVGFIIGMLVAPLAELLPGTTPTPTGQFTTQDFFWTDFWQFFLTGAFMLACLGVFLWKVREVPTGTKFFRVGEHPVVVDVYTQQIVPSGTPQGTPGDEGGPKVDDREEAGREEGGREEAGREEGGREVGGPEVEDREDEPSKPSFFGEWHTILQDEDKSAFWVLLAVFAYLFGFNALEFSFGRFATSFLQISEAYASLLLAIMPVMLIVAAIPAGRLATKYGRLKIMKLGLVIMGACTLGIILAMGPLRQAVAERAVTIVDLIPVIVLLSLAGVGYGFTHINALPVVWQLAPEDKIGAYTGVYYMISALGSILSPLAMSTIYALVRGVGGNQWLALFPYFLAGCAVGFVFLLRVRRGDAEPLTPEKLAELQARYAGAGD